MKNLQAALTPSSQRSLAPRLYEGTSKHKDIFESLTLIVSVCTILCGRLNIGPMGRTSKKIQNYELIDFFLNFEK